MPKCLQHPAPLEVIEMKGLLTNFALLIMAASLLPGCKVGPNYRNPVARGQTAYRGPNDNPPDQAASFADLPWWQVFHDPVLQDLIRRALKQNYDLQTVTERITQARAQLMITRSNQFPQVTANGTAVDERSFQGFPFTTRYATYGADDTFQPELFVQRRP